MKILAVDTSTKMGSVALTEGENLLAQIQLNVELTHTEKLLPAIENVLSRTGLTMENVEGLAAAIGPGSFTGLRIGLATMKAIAQARNLPLAGVSSLLALACNLWGSDTPVAACLDAHRGEVYGAMVRWCDGAIVKNMLEEQVIKPDVLCNILKNAGPCWLVGDGALRYRQTFKDRLGESALFPPGIMMRAEAKWAAWLAAPGLKRGEGRDWKTLAPNYLRKSDAEKSAIVR